MSLLTLERDRGRNGWIVDYETLERLTVKANDLGVVSMEDTEAVILALVDEGFVHLEDPE